MSLSPPPPWSSPRANSPARRPSARLKPPKLRWGWIEITILVVMLCPALTFLPFLSPARLLLRIANYSIGLVAWAGVLVFGRPKRMPQFTGRSWAYFCAGWLALQVFNPSGDLPLAVPAHFLLDLSILSPVFWAPRISTSYSRVYLILKIIYAWSLASVLVGFLQFYHPGQVLEKSYIPGRFDPPTIPYIEMNQETGYWKGLLVAGPGGGQAFRPFGLTDSPGGAAMAASNCCLVGMLWILRRGPLWKRAAHGIVCLMSMVMLYYCQVRVIYLVTLGSLGLLGVCLFLRRDFRSLTVLATLGLAIFAAALVWTLRHGGEEILKRFGDLVDKSSTKVYQENRGRFLETVFEELIWDYPLGAGLGRWGMMNVYFGNPANSLYSEIQLSAWLYDGGIPLMAGYAGAVLLCIWHVFQLALRARDPEFSKTASAVVGMSAGVFVSGFSGMPFISPAGLLCWLLLGATIGAAAHEARARSNRPAPRGRT